MSASPCAWNERGGRGKRDRTGEVRRGTHGERRKKGSAVVSRQARRVARIRMGRAR
jgi:hypothetical protein